MSKLDGAQFRAGSETARLAPERASSIAAPWESPMRIITTIAYLAVIFTAAACSENESTERTSEASAKRAVKTSDAPRIVGSWIIDEAAQKKEVARISPSELEDFDEAFKESFSSIRETFHRDGRYEVTSPLGGPFDDRWELVSEDATTLTVRSSGHSWVARRAAIGANTHERSTSVLTYTFSDRDHMFVTTRIPLFGEEKDVSYFFVRDE
jgi:hypothetical protein